MCNHRSSGTTATRSCGFSVEQIANPMITLRVVQSSRVKSPMTSMRALVFHDLNAVMNVTWSAECHHTDTLMQDATAIQDSVNVLKKDSR